MRTASVALSSLAVLCSVLPGRAVAAAGGRISVSIYHSCTVTPVGGVKCWGTNYSGRLGDGTTLDRSTPVDVKGLTGGVTAVSAGEVHTCALTAGGGVKCWGYNYFGALGDGSTTNHITPMEVAGLTSGATAISAGQMHTCAVTASGGVKCWGGNYYGQLGDGTTTDRLTPVDVPGLTSGVRSVSAGQVHTCAVTVGGAVRCWGSNGSGQLGDGTKVSSLTPLTVPGLNGMTDVAAGLSHTCALAAGIGVKCWGSNFSGQLGDGTTEPRATPVDVPGTAGVASIAAGSQHTCAVTASGGVRCWGDNESGQLGDGSMADRSTPTDVLGMSAGVTAVAAAVWHTCAVTSGGGVRCWGRSDDGALGNGAMPYSSTPVAVAGLTAGAVGGASGTGQTCVFTTDGAARCWGTNSYGRLGDGTITNRMTPTGVSGLASGVVAMSAGLDHSCAVTSGGAAKCWGAAYLGQVGDGAFGVRLSPVGVSGLASGVAAISAGYEHTCALTTAGGVKCWGSGYGGRLGDGINYPRSAPGDVPGLTTGVVAVAVGTSHSCAVTAAGGVKCWGNNYLGSLGDGTTTERPTPVDVVGLATGVVAVVAGSSHTCALTTAGGVQCWGLGYGLTPAFVPGLTAGVAVVTAGGYHDCALTTAGGVKCWGENLRGQLGDGTTTGRTTPGDVVGLTSGVSAVFAGKYHTCAVATTGGVWCWGDDRYGQLGDRVGNPPFVPARALGLGRPDFDGDDKVDVGVYRPASGAWFSLDSTTSNTTYRYRGWGVDAQGDTPVVGDFDGDGILDPAVFRPAAGTWFVLKSRGDYTTWDSFGWGAATDVLVPGDYDGDGITDAAVYRPSTGTWYVRPSSGGTSWTLSFGNATDTPIAGDFDGDGKRDPAVYRASTGTWFWLKSSTNFTTYDYEGWGVDAQGDTPAPGDYDGDGRTDPCVFRPGTGTWFILESHTDHTTMSYFGWGTTGDTLVPADYDGDGKTDGAIYRAATGTWYIRPSSGATPWSKVFGNATDVPLR